MNEIQPSRSLDEFVGAIEVLFQSLVSGSPYRVIPDSLELLVERSWAQIRESLIDVRGWLRGAKKGGQENVELALQRVGLSGDQLALKLTGFFQAYHRFEARLSRGLNQFVRHVRECLRWANIVLGSLAVVCEPAEPVKEFKEVLEAAIEYSGAPSRRA